MGGERVKVVADLTMKRRTLKRLRPDAKPEHHHNVYVVLLKPGPVLQLPQPTNTSAPCTGAPRSSRTVPDTLNVFGGGVGVVGVVGVFGLVGVGLDRSPPQERAKTLAATASIRLMATALIMQEQWAAAHVCDGWH